MKNAVGLVYSNSEKNNNKFYIVWIEGNVVNTNWGRIGYNGQSKLYPCATYEEAVNLANTKVKAKLRKGYWRCPIEKITSHNASEFINNG